MARKLRPNAISPPRNNSFEIRLPTASTRRMRVPGAAFSKASRTAVTALCTPPSSPCAGRRSAKVAGSPNCNSVASPSPSPPTAPRSTPISPGPGVRISISTPPLKSIPFSSPGWKAMATESVESTAEMMSPVLAPRMKGMRVPSGKIRKSGRRRRSHNESPGRWNTGNSLGRVRRYHQEAKSRVSTVAVHICTMVPMATVTAKPFTGPEPKPYRHAMAIRFVTLESRMVPDALV